MTNARETEQPEVRSCGLCGGTQRIHRHYAGMFICDRCWAAAPNSRKPSSAEGTAFASAHGWVALRWIAEPTRAGWWVAWDGRYMHLFHVTNLGKLTNSEGLHVWHSRDGERETWLPPRESGMVGWAGPVEPPKAPLEATPPNGKLSDAGGKL